MEFVTEISSLKISYMTILRRKSKLLTLTVLKIKDKAILTSKCGPKQVVFITKLLNIFKVQYMMKKSIFGL